MQAGTAKEALGEIIRLVEHLREQERTMPTTRNKERDARLSGIDSVLRLLRGIEVES